MMVYNTIYGIQIRHLQKYKSQKIAMKSVSTDPPDIRSIKKDNHFQYSWITNTAESKINEVSHTHKITNSWKHFNDKKVHMKSILSILGNRPL